MNPIEIKLVFEDHANPLDPRELANYLYLLSGFITASQDLDIKNKFDPSQISNESLEGSIIDIFEGISPLKWREYFSSERETALDLKKITSNSPLEIFAYAASVSVILVSFAIVLSGGKLKVSGTGFEAELPPLGHGIKKLLKAMGLDRKDRQLGFGVQSVTIKLRKDEYDTLMIPLKGEGGFQHFMRKLQSKTNKTTKTITLSVEDLDRIQSYKANPGSGGFQSRYNKIFSRHLENE
jgi:hypothetical protein